MHIFYFQALVFSRTSCATDSYGQAEGLKAKNNKLYGEEVFGAYTAGESLVFNRNVMLL
jgi:hypothetical protein